MKKEIKKKKMILVIEDERALLKAITIKLEKNNFQVITSRSVERAFSPPIKNISFSSVELALKHLEELERVDAILLDHDLLGDENGLDFVKKFKANGGKWAKVPIFVVSNTASSELVKNYAKLGVKKYYIKAENRLEDIVKDISSSLEKKK